MKCSDDQVRPFPLSLQFQNGPRRQGFASPRKTRAPLTVLVQTSQDVQVLPERVP